MKEYLLRIFYWVFRGVPITKVYAKITEVNYNKRLAGKKVLITGGGRGLGFYMAKKFIESGAQVVILGRDKENLRKASLKLKNCPYLPFDVRDFNDFNNVIKKADELVGGGLNCLVNNAGVSLHEHEFKAVSIEDFDTQFDTNIKAPYFLSQAFIKYAENLGRVGRDELNILFITSERGLYGDTLPYGLTKAAINSLTQGLARFYVKNGIRVNAIAPGVTASDMTRVDKDGDLYRDRACGKRVLIPEEIAASAVFLLSDESNCITGNILPCNQGNHLRSDY